MPCPVAARDTPVFLFHVEDNNTVRPVQQIGNDDPHALAAACRCRKKDMLRAAEYQVFAADPADNQPLFIEESCFSDFVTAGKTRISEKAFLFLARENEEKG